MPNLPLKVQPGDLITAEFMNLVVDVCADLQQRMAQLEHPDIGPTSVRIDSLLPSGTRRIGDPIHIIGQGFDAPAGTVVTIDGIGVQVSFGLDRDRELVVTIPNLQGVPDAGRNVTLVVTNARGTDMQDIVVFPALATLPQGQLFVQLIEPPEEPQLLAGQAYTFVYRVQAIVNLDESYLLSASVDLGWSAQIVDAGNNPITGEIQLPSAPPPAGATQTVRVRVSIPLGIPDQTVGQLRLTVTSRRNPSNLVGRSGGETITVNDAPPLPMDVAITLGAVTRLVASQPVPTTTGGVVRIGATAENYRITFSAQIRADTVYTVALVAPTDARWSASLSGSPTPVLQQTIGPATSATSQPLFIFIHAGAGSPDADITLSVTSTSDPTKFGRIVQPVGLL